MRDNMHMIDNMTQQEKLTQLIHLMVEYDKGEAELIQHFVKVHGFATTIGIAEGMNNDELFILQAAAIVHDIGIPKAMKLYGNCDGKHQEELGPEEARHLLADMDFTEAQVERICWLIAHHHTTSNVTSLDHRILLEADFLVNSFEANVSREGIIAFRNNVFRSASAIALLNTMWNLEQA